MDDYIDTSLIYLLNIAIFTFESNYKVYKIFSRDSFLIILILTNMMNMTPEIKQHLKLQYSYTNVCQRDMNNSGTLRMCQVRKKK